MAEIDRRRLLKMLGAAAAGLGSRDDGSGARRGGAGLVDRRDAPDPAHREVRSHLPHRPGGRGLLRRPGARRRGDDAGGLGVLGPVPEAPEGTRRQIQETPRLTSGPFGVDFVYFPFFDRSVSDPASGRDPEHRARNATWSITDAHVDVLVEEKVDFVVWYWTAPEVRWVRRLKDAGIRQWAQVGSVEGALEAVGYGAEVIIAQGNQAGGHARGQQDGKPLHRSELVPLVRNAVPKDVLVVGSGGVADGRTLVNALAEGAEGGWVGTRFAVSAESYAHDEYMRRVIAVEDGWTQTAPTTLFGPEFPNVFTRSIVNRVLSEW
jgi:NAD(P)H-dependent flavin oxidoreductase YrpB (nitropropane dioxygenase family)